MKHKSAYKVSVSDASSARMKEKVSTAVVFGSSSGQLQERGNQMRQWVEQSGGEYETAFIAREEYRDNGNVGAREIGWVYRKTR